MIGKIHSKHFINIILLTSTIFPIGITNIIN